MNNTQFYTNPPAVVLTVDKAGRVVILKALRDDLRLEPGDALELESEGELVMLRPVRSSKPLRKERGIWVFRTGRKLLIPPATSFADRRCLLTYVVTCLPAFTLFVIRAASTVHKDWRRRGNVTDIDL